MNAINVTANGAASPQDEGPPMVLYASIVWNALLAVGSVWLAIVIFGMDDFGRLGRPVQYFAGVVTLIPAGVAVYSSIMLLMRRPAGRYSAMAIQFVVMVLGLIAVLTSWGLWDSFEFIVDGVLIAPWVPLGFAVAYVLNWIANRMDETSSARGVFQQAAMAAAALTLIVILWFSGLLDGIMHVLDVYSDFTVSEDAVLAPAVQAWLATFVMLISGWLAWQMLNLDRYFGETPFEREAWQGWLMLSPNIIGFTIFFAGPLLLSLYLSFTDSTVGATPNFIGISNYAEITALEFKALGEAANAQDVLSFGFNELMTLNWFGSDWVIGAKDTLFWRSLGNTLLFCGLLIPLSTIPALALALILNSELPGMKFYRAVYFLPSVAAVVGTALIWRWLYNPTVGFINYSINQIILAWNGVFGTEFARAEILWLSDPNLVLISIVLLASWQVVGFNTVLFLAGLQGVPKVLYEAAMIDGANNWQRLTNVTIPLLAPTTFFVIITTIIQGLQVFNEPYTLFVNQQPIPVNATTSVYYLYRRGFFFFDFGYASAVAWILFAVIFVITFIQFRVQRADAYE